MGRSLSASAHSKILAATAALVSERGIDQTSMDAIAVRAGVSKATIYNHWVDKDALLIVMLLFIHGIHNRPKFDSGDTKADIKAVLAYRPQEDPELRARITPHIVAYSATRKEFGLVWRNSIMEPPRRELRHLLESGIRKGELAPGLDFEVALALLLGPMMYWFIFLRHDEKDPPSELAGKVVEAFWAAFATPVKAKRA